MTTLPRDPNLGLPEDLPPGETALWQGSPDWRRLAIEVFHVRAVAVYFALLLAWNIISGLSDGLAGMVVLRDAGWTLVLGLLALGLLVWMAWLCGTTSVYTITNKRVVLRIGMALSMGINLPFNCITNAAVRSRPDGTGNVELELNGDGRVGYWHLWPHARPWKWKEPRPMLRCVPDSERVARTLAAALRASLSPEESLAASVADAGPRAGAPPSTETLDVREGRPQTSAV